MTGIWDWVAAASPAYYAYNALVKNEFEAVSGLYITSVIGNLKESVGPFKGDVMLACFDLGEVRKTSNHGEWAPFSIFRF